MLNIIKIDWKDKIKKKRNMCNIDRSRLGSSNGECNVIVNKMVRIVNTHYSVGYDFRNG
jgi:hypothetical protein